MPVKNLELAQDNDAYAFAQEKYFSSGRKDGNAWAEMWRLINRYERRLIKQYERNNGLQFPPDDIEDMSADMTLWVMDMYRKHPEFKIDRMSAYAHFGFSKILHSPERKFADGMRKRINELDGVRADSTPELLKKFMVSTVPEYDPSLEVHTVRHEATAQEVPKLEQEFLCRFIAHYDFSNRINARTADYWDIMANKKRQSIFKTVVGKYINFEKCYLWHGGGVLAQCRMYEEIKFNSLLLTDNTRHRCGLMQPAQLYTSFWKKVDNMRLIEEGRKSPSAITRRLLYNRFMLKKSPIVI